MPNHHNHSGKRRMFHAGSSLRNPVRGVRRVLLKTGLLALSISCDVVGDDNTASKPSATPGNLYLAQPVQRPYSNAIPPSGLTWENRVITKPSDNGIPISEVVKVPVLVTNDGNRYYNFLPAIYHDSEGKLKAVTDPKEVKEEHVVAMKDYLEDIRKAKDELSSTKTDEEVKAKAKAKLTDYLTFVSNLELDQRDETLKNAEEKVAKLRLQLESNRKSQKEMISMQIRMLEMASEGVSLPEPWMQFLNRADGKPSAILSGEPFVSRNSGYRNAYPTNPPVTTYQPVNSSAAYSISPPVVGPSLPPGFAAPNEYNTSSGYAWSPYPQPFAPPILPGEVPVPVKQPSTSEEGSSGAADRRNASSHSVRVDPARSSKPAPKTPPQPPQTPLDDSGKPTAPE